MVSYQIKKRPQIEDHQLKLKLNDSNEKYNVIHPSLVTIGADLYLLQKTEGCKDTVIPVHREFIMTVIPYFAKQYSDDGIWREGKLKDQEDINISQLPETVNITAVVAYIKSLYETNYNPFSLENCLDILELADYWCDQFMKTECLNYIEEAMNDDLFEKIYDNPRIQSSVGKIVNDYMKRERSLNCHICENNRFHVLLPKKSTSAVLTNSNRAIVFKTEPENSNFPIWDFPIWDFYTTRCIPKNSAHHEIQLKFRITHNCLVNAFVGIVDDSVNASDVFDVSKITSPNMFYGFCMNKFLHVLDAKTTIEAGRPGLSQKFLHVPILNDTTPFDKFVQNDVFTLIYSETILKLESDRGFKCCVQLDPAPEVKFKFCVQISNHKKDRSNDGKGLELLPDFDHVCEI